MQFSLIKIPTTYNKWTKDIDFTTVTKIPDEGNILCVKSATKQNVVYFVDLDAGVL